MKIDNISNNNYTNNKKVNVETCGEQIAMEVTSPFEVVFPEDEINRDYEFEVQYGN